MSIKNSDHYFLRGGGEMGEMIRAKDWSKTSLGDPGDWPQSFRTTLGILLKTKFPMFLWWGNELTCFYNDAYRPSLGKDGKHPSILGMPAKEAWPEIWEIIKPLIDKVVYEEEAIWFEDMLVPIYRNGKIEEVYWTFSYSPVPGDNDKVVGVLVTCTETTEKVNTLRKIEESNARFINNIMQAPVAMCIFRGENHVVEIANEQMLIIWGKQAEQVINKPIFEGLPEAKDQGLEVLLENVYTTGEKFVANERMVKLPRNGKLETTYVNFVYDALKEADGTISGIVAIAIEVTPQVISRSKVEESEQKVRALVENAPFPIAVYVGKEMIVELANQSIIDIWGKGNDVIGKSFKEVLPELDNQLVFEQIEKVITTGESFHTKNTPLDLIIDGNLRTYYFNYSFTPLYDVAGNIYGVMNTGVDLTDLNIAKKQIEEADKRFRNTVKQAPVGITILRGPQYVVEMANEAYLKLLDKKEDEFVGRALFDVLPEVEESVHSLLDSVLHTGVPYHGNEVPIPVIRYGKQELYYFDFLYHPLKEENGEISGIIVTVTEVTEKVEARRNIEQNEERLSIVVEASELGTWELNLKTMTPQYSKRYLEIIGGYKDAVDLTHEQLLSHLHPDDMQIREKAFKEGMATGKLQYEARLIWIDNSIHWMEGNGKVFYDAEHQPEKMIGTIRDITAEKKHQQELEEREKRFRLLAESLPQLVWETDDKGNALFASGRWQEYTGIIPSGEAEWKAIIHPDDFEENAGIWMNSLATGELYRCDVRLKSKAGDYRWHTAIGEPVFDQENKIVKWVGAFTDIETEKAFTQELEKQVAERTKELGDTNLELGKMNKELQTFAYISSHDLQEPLRKIQTFSTQIREKEAQNLSEGGKDKFRRMEIAANRMQTLIDDLLAYSRINTQKGKFEKTDLNTIIKEVQEDLKEEFQYKHATIQVNELCEANIIPFQFKQLLYNLLSNSLKFSSPDRTLHIVMESEIADGETFNNPKLTKDIQYCHLSVTDNGIGFEQQYSEKIFEVFQRLHGKHEYNGTGIGLSIVKRIVEIHNGVITAKGELNKGATFDIYIPAA